MGDDERLPGAAERILFLGVDTQAGRHTVQNGAEAHRRLDAGGAVDRREARVHLQGQPGDQLGEPLLQARVAAAKHGLELIFGGEVLLPDDPTVGERLVERLGAGVVAEVGGFIVPNSRTSSRR